MKKALQICLLLLVAAAIVVFLYQRYFPNEEKRILKMLARLAETASVSENAGTIATLAATDRLRNFFTSDVEVTVEIPGEGSYTASGRQEILSAAMTARNAYHDLKIQFVDIFPALSSDKQTATASLTARVNLRGDKDFVVQELKIQLRKEDDEWRISKVETVRTLKQ